MDKQTEKVIINVKPKQGLNVNLNKDSGMAVTLGSKQGMAISSPTIGQLSSDYNKLINKPQINTIELKGNKTSRQLGLQDSMDSLTNLELDDLIKF